MFEFLKKKAAAEYQPPEPRQADILAAAAEQPHTFDQLAARFHDATLRACFRDGLLLNRLDQKTGRSYVTLTGAGVAALEVLK